MNKLIYSKGYVKFMALFCAMGICVAATTEDVMNIKFWGPQLDDWSWVHKGSVYTYVYHSDHGQISFSVYLESGSKQPLIITSSLDIFSHVVNQEVAAKDLKVFIQKTLPDFLSDYSSFDNMRLLDNLYLKNYEGTLTAMDFPADVRGDAASYALLKKLCAEPVVTFDEEKSTWRIAFNVLCYDDGRVEHWTFTGTFDKFEIKSWTRDNLIERGKIRPIRESGSSSK